MNFVIKFVWKSKNCVGKGLLHGFANKLPCRRLTLHGIHWMDKFITGILKKILQIIVHCLKNFQQELYFFGYLGH